MKKNLNTLQDWLDWQQTLHPLNIDFKLERIKSVYTKLNIQDIAKKGVPKQVLNKTQRLNKARDTFKTAVVKPQKNMAYI